MSRKKRRDEVLVGEGITIARSGRFLSIRSHRTPEQQAALRSVITARRAAVPEEIQQRVARLDAIMARYNPLDLIASAALKHLFVDPESFAEHSHEGSQAEVEYIALVCLRYPFREGELRESDGSDFDTVFTLVHEIFQLTHDSITFDLPDEGVDGAALAAHELRLRTRLNELVVRGPGYPHHLVEVLRKLFGDGIAAEWMQCELGFTIDDAIRLDTAVAEIVQTRLATRLEKAKEDEKKLRRALTRFRRSGEVSESIPRKLLAHLAELKEREARRTIRGLLSRWAVFAWGDTYSFTAGELAVEAGVPPAVAEAFLNAFSLEFGAIPIDEYMPSPTHPLRVRPFIRHPRGYICPSPASVLWAIRPRLESMMKPGGRESRGTSDRTWNRYQKARADFLVNRTLDLLAQILKRAQVYRNLSYEGGELDGLVLFDTYAFLMEAKAGDFGPPARRGAPRGMLEDLRALVAEPHRQAIRARDFIDQNDMPAFTASDGTRVEFDKAKYRNRILMTVTLEPLDVFVTTFQQLKEVGLFADAEMPWAIQLLDLRIMADLIEFPSQLTHYLSRRLRLNELGKLHAHDELDWFGHYLSEGLFFEGAVDDLDRLSLTSYTGDIDAYYFFITGQRKTPARKPQQPMPDLYRQVLAELEERDGEGYVSVSMALLDLGGRDRKVFAKHLKRMREQSARDGRFHDFTMGYQSHGWGLTVMSGPAGSLREVHAKLSAFCSLRKYELRCERWMGLGTVADLPGIVHAWASVAFPWVADEGMEEVVRKVHESKRRAGR